MMDDVFARQRQAHGSWASIVWLIAGGFLFATHGPATILSWQALVYFLPGTFAAALLFGLLGFSLQISVTRALSRLGEENKPPQAVLIGLGYGLIALEALLIYLAAQWIVMRILFPV